MKYLVVLDSRTIAGAEYLDGNHEGTVMGHPAIVCSEVQMDAPYFHCVRPMGDDGRQTLWFPHHTIALVCGFEREPPRGIGFVPASRG